MKEINIANFSGPLDLLLHLAKTNEIEIKDISLDELINQYLNYIQQVQELGIDVASSYLEMAAELIRLKSVYLLPEAPADEELSEILSEIGIDRETLIKKLLEYKSYKEVIPEFNILIEKRQAYYQRDPEPLIEFRKNNFENSITISELTKAMHNHLLSLQSRKKETKIIEHNELNIDKYIKDFEELTTTISFQTFIYENTRSNIISMFLAVLECLKNQVISVKVMDNDFIISKYEGEICEE